MQITRREKKNIFLRGLSLGTAEKYRTQIISSLIRIVFQTKNTLWYSNIFFSWKSPVLQLPAVLCMYNVPVK